ncbi:3TM-type holin [Flagellimonas sp. 2504JD4-2]
MIDKILGIFSNLATSREFLALFKGKERKLQEFQLAMVKEMQKANFHQIELNKIEAKHKSLFVSGWRPFIGWVCGSALAYHFILRDLVYWFLDAVGVNVSPLPTIELGQLISILLAMLGMSGYRTYEKIKKVK